MPAMIKIDGLPSLRPRAAFFLIRIVEKHGIMLVDFTSVSSITGICRMERLELPKGRFVIAVAGAWPLSPCHSDPPTQELISFRAFSDQSGN
jgi:hypothetical protein